MKPIKISFGENPHVIPLDFYPKSEGAKWFTLYRAFEVTLSNGDIITIPAGFKTDLSSVPKVLWGLFPPFGRGLMAYIIHDFLYEKQMYTRRFSDKEMVIWATALEQLKLDPKARYYTVRAFGWMVWNDLKELENENDTRNI